MRRSRARRRPGSCAARQAVRAPCRDRARRCARPILRARPSQSSVRYSSSPSSGTSARLSSAPPQPLYSVSRKYLSAAAPQRNCRSGAAGPCGSAPAPAAAACPRSSSALRISRPRFSSASAWLVVDRVDPGRGDLHRQGDDVDRGLGDGADDAAAEQAAGGREREYASWPNSQKSPNSQ